MEFHKNFFLAQYFVLYGYFSKPPNIGRARRHAQAFNTLTISKSAAHALK